MRKIYTIFAGFFLLSYVGINAASDSITDDFISRALQGDLSTAQSLFSNAEIQARSISTVELSRQFHSRFIARDDTGQPETGSTLANRVITAYREYWTLSLMGDLSRPQAESILEAALWDILSTEDEQEVDRNSGDVFVLLGEALKHGGFHFLQANAPPLRDLFLWKSEENRNFSVRLTDSTENVSVVFMTEIFSMGWKEYATLGLVSTTGWVEEGRLYCVDWAYDRQSENFRISFLKHETRHLADFKRFPGLSSTDLEYRAKLTELAFASTTMTRVLDDFTQKSAPNPESPHAYANYRVTRDVYGEIYGTPLPDSRNPWVQVSDVKVSRAARSLLKNDSNRLQAGSP
jgi:hypothetical protein